MTARTCLYCSRKIEPDDAVAMCDACYVGHHRECWERNGRCSTFRCAGAPRMMDGAHFETEWTAALEFANAEPRNCPLCGGTVYPGSVCGRKTQSTDNPTGSALVFVVRRRTGERGSPRPRRLLDRLFGPRSWVLPGVRLRALSCGNCRALFIWGQTMDDAYLQIAQAQASGRYCVHCGVSMWEGAIQLNSSTGAHARFWCDTAPQFHSDWLLHNTLDR
ncbi:MAG: hypothetical protein GX446_12355, partial [Chthonomonadales bacterium]|nr:hypothetical protein [Chthonomonadales bacterium]